MLFLVSVSNELSFCEEVGGGLNIPPPVDKFGGAAQVKTVDGAMLGDGSSLIQNTDPIEVNAAVGSVVINENRGGGIQVFEDI